jgi:(p)ppGpp synthase/HD superfamily hydrolase
MTRKARALQMARKAHAGETRDWNGQPYVCHPIRVAARVEVMGGSEDMVIAALLHDTLEDTKLPPEAILQAFGPKVLAFVRELTNPSNGSNLPRATRKAMDRDHLRSVSPEARLIKLLDREGNLLEMAGCGAPRATRKRYRQESELLFDALRGTHPEAEAALARAIRTLAATESAT